MIRHVTGSRQAGEWFSNWMLGDLIHLGIAEQLRMAGKGNADQEWQNRNTNQQLVHACNSLGLSWNRL